MTILTSLLICLAPVAIDGDTVKCGDGTSLRIWGVNAPEKKQPGSVAATESLAVLTVGGLVCQPKGASFSRIVAQCFNGAGKDVARVQLERGHGKEVCGFSKGFYGGCD